MASRTTLECPHEGPSVVTPVAGFQRLAVQIKGFEKADLLPLWRLVVPCEAKAGDRHPVYVCVRGREGERERGRERGSCLVSSD